MNSTPRANRLTIAFFGRRNAGKSSLINALTGQEVSLVSNVAGSTADPVSKSMELLPIGPVTIIDTAGLDDEGDLGAQKIRRTQEILERSDLAILVCDASRSDRSLEQKWLQSLVAKEGLALLIVENKIDLLSSSISPQVANWPPTNIPQIRVSTTTGEGLASFTEALVLVAQAAQATLETSLVAGLLPPNSIFMLVTPQDIQAPKGRLILPQVQVLRDILDHGGLALVAGYNELGHQLKVLNRPPDLIICDSQVFKKVTGQVDPTWPVTTFSIIMARSKGNLAALVAGAHHLDKLKPGARVLIAEACTHHAQKNDNDIAREQIPRLVREKVGGEVHFEFNAGHDFVNRTDNIDLIIACGGCMITPKHYQGGIDKATQAQVPMTNFGLVMAHLSGQMDRAVAIFSGDKA